jgi:serine phosphatase RsbU (regulator of sigma subunit)
VERVVRKFAQRVIGIHALLLLVLLLIVGLASRTIYRSAREQALDQAKAHQALLVAQTARGIEGFYGSILDALDLMRLAEEQEGDFAVDPVAPGRASPPARSQPGAVAPQAPAVGVRARAFARLIERQLEGRVSQVFIVERVPGGGEPRLHPVGRPDAKLPISDVLTHLGEWLAGVRRPSVSPFKVHPQAGGYNVVAAPARHNPNLLLVATVPVAPMEAELLTRLTRGDTVATLLADDANVVMAAGKPAWVGRNLNELGGPVVSSTLADLHRVGLRDQRVISSPFRLGDQSNPSAMFATEPVEVAGRKWLLLIASPLEDVDAAVTDLVRNGLPWIVFVVLAMTGLLASTSVQLIRNRVRLERERTRALEADIANARQIQLAWLPKDGVVVHEAVDVAAVNMPAAHVSGDFYNWFALPDGRVAVVVGDVTGHGMSAAFLMATVQLMVRNTLPQVGEPGKCLEQVNDQLCVQMFHGQFVTIQVLVIDPVHHRVELANAGHPPPLVCDAAADGNGDADADGSGDRNAAIACRPLKVEPQLVLGIQSGVEYPTERFELSPCSGMLLYTDGVLDAVSVDGHRFDVERLRTSVNSSCASAAELVQSVVDTLTKFRGGRELVDDLTLVAVQLQPATAAPSPTAPLEQASTT